MFHQHRFEEVRRYFIPPTPRDIQMDRASERLWQQLLMGVTVIELRCESCGMLSHHELPGDTSG